MIRAGGEQSYKLWNEAADDANKTCGMLTGGGRAVGGPGAWPVNSSDSASRSACQVRFIPLSCGVVCQECAV